MTHDTAITWTHRPGTKGCTWNPIRARDRLSGLRGWHCEHVSEACRNCYAERQNMSGARGGTKLSYKPGHYDQGYAEVYLDEKTLAQPLHWRSPRTIFVCSMTDLFGRWVKDEWLDRIFAVAALCPQHTFIMLTKRSERMNQYLTGGSRINRRYAVWQAMYGEAKTRDAGIALDSFYGGPSSHQWPLRNVWLGVTAEDQLTVGARVPLLLATPAAVRFVSVEPMLSTVDLLPYLFIYTYLDYAKLDAAKKARNNGHKLDDEPLPYNDPKITPTAEIATPRLDWVICGGESGANARPMHPDWARLLRDQCDNAGVPFYFKQWGEWSSVYDRQRVDSDWHRCSEVERSTPNGQWLNLAGGQGFHGENVIRVDRVGKKRAGRLLDGRELNEWPEVHHD